MRKTIALALVVPAVTLAFAATSPARADSTSADGVCQQRLTEVSAEWKASPIPASTARSAGWGSNGGGKLHDHPGMVTNYMQRQINSARRLCAAGKEHDALLHLDVVRAWLKLPFEEHPVSHEYHPKN